MKNVNNVDIEDEKHFLLNCYPYDNLREIFFDNISTHLPIILMK